MKLGRCPVCKSHLDLQAMAEDEAGRELLAKLTRLPSHLAGPLLGYLGLFRPAKQDLSNSRTLKLLEETLALSSDRYLLGAAMTETAQQLHANRRAGSAYSPLKNHHYLKKVVAGIAERTGQSVTAAASHAPSAAKPAGEKHDETLAWKRQMENFGYQVTDDGRVIEKGHNHE